MVLMEYLVIDNVIGIEIEAIFQEATFLIKLVFLAPVKKNSLLPCIS